MQEQIIEMVVQQLAGRCPVPCPLGVILGSGLGDYAETVQDAVRIPFAEIPHFPASSVAGHAGVLVAGRLHGHAVALMQGRVHYYEGHSPDDVIFPARVLHGLGVKTLIVTNAAGGINPEFRPGDLMVIRDHINFMGFNPLRGKLAERFGPRFPDMSYAYHPELRALARGAAGELGIPVREGIYLGLSGPSYETPAEIRMFRGWGADAVGMSTVPEVIAANQMGMRVLGISCITNMAAGILDQPLTHQEVLETTARVKDQFTRLVDRIIAGVRP
jgi:purine-nucleoside phosphorylase